MKIGFVSSNMYLDIIHQMVETEFSHIDVMYFTYENYTDAPGLLEQHQSECDAVIFSGSLAYYYCRANFMQKVPWIAVKPHSSSLAMALREAIEKGYSLKRISVNLADVGLTNSACREVGVNPNDITIFNRNVDVSEYAEPDYSMRIYRYIRRQFEENGITCGLTANLWAYKRMLAEGYPVVFMRTSLDSFRAAFHEVYRRVLVGKDDKAQIVAVIVSGELPDDTSVMVQSDYTYMRRRLKMMEKVYEFSTRIQGVVCDESSNRYMIIAAKEDFEAETEGFKEFRVFKELNRNTLERYFVGVGYGVTAIAARKNARVALEQAKHNGSNSACLVSADGNVASLISYLTENDEGAGGNKIDRMAARTGLSAELLRRLIKVMEKSDSNRFTSAELAVLLGSSKRNMDRMLLRLESAGIANMVGKVADGERGRPKRVFELNFDFK